MAFAEARTASTAPDASCRTFDHRRHPFVTDWARWARALHVEPNERRWIAAVGAEQQTIDQREDNGVDADPKCEDQDHGEIQESCAADLTNAKAEILQKNAELDHR